MIGHEIEGRTGEELVALVRALGKHRYVAGRSHLVHLFAVEAAAPAEDPDLQAAADWARRVRSAGVLDLASKDERLFRSASDAEVTAVIAAYWSSPHRAACRDRLTSLLASIDAPPPLSLPFDENAENELFPVLVDAGWELLPLTELDRERHKGAILAFGEDLGFDVARFEEENAVPRSATLHELPLFGIAELSHAFDDDGRTRAPFVLWAQGNETYLDYVLRGVLRAAKLEG